MRFPTTQESCRYRTAHNREAAEAATALVAEQARCSSRASQRQRASQSLEAQTTPTKEFFEKTSYSSNAESLQTPLA